jgi:sugar lactone lactonase YvrE
MEDTGRFLMYDSISKKTKVLIQGLRFPNGVAVSKDGSFVVVAETGMSRSGLRPLHHTGHTLYYVQCKHHTV